MATFPSITPTTRLYTQGDFPSAIQQSSTGATTGLGVVIGVLTKHYSLHLIILQKHR